MPIKKLYGIASALLFTASSTLFFLSLLPSFQHFFVSSNADTLDFILVWHIPYILAFYFGLKILRYGKTQESARMPISNTRVIFMGLVPVAYYATALILFKDIYI